MAQTNKPQSYEQAMSELRDILTQLELEDTDVDQLGELVARAAVLIRFCRGRLDKAEMKVNQVIDSLVDSEDNPAEPDLLEPNSTEPAFAKPNQEPF